MRVEVDSLLLALYSVGMTGFEPATTRPPDEYSNRAELHPAVLHSRLWQPFSVLVSRLRCKGKYFLAKYQILCFSKAKYCVHPAFAPTA